MDCLRRCTNGFRTDRRGNVGVTRHFSRSCRKIFIMLFESIPRSLSNPDNNTCGILLGLEAEHNVPLMECLQTDCSMRVFPRHYGRDGFESYLSEPVASAAAVSIRIAFKQKHTPALIILQSLPLRIMTRCSCSGSFYT